MKTTAVVIARFQTPYLHDGHRHLLDGIKAKHHKVVVVLGISPVKGSRRNPFDFYTREKLLKKAYPDFVVLPLADNASDEVWSTNLDELLLSSFPNEEFILYGSRDSFIPFYNGCLPTEELPEQGDYSATVIRNEYADKVIESEDFRLGINYACHNMYSKIYPTVDIAVFKENRSYILLGRKKNRKEWRLPGGFVDVNDIDFEASAKRELHEECGSIETGPMYYIGSAKIDDWRYRNEEDKIMTLLFATDLVYGHAMANDDLQEVKWFEVKKLDEMIANGIVAKEHQALLELLEEKWIKKTQLLTQNFDV
jgi:bifunctional NMN adenylyltransferase/nudix hydrolase